MIPSRSWLEERRWFAGKGRRIREVREVDRALLPSGPSCAIVETLFEDGGGPELYFVPGEDGASLGRALYEAVARGEPICTMRGGAITAARGPGFAVLDGEVAPLGAEQSNSSFRLGGRLVAKCFRRLWPGVSPELEMGRFLAERTDFRELARIAGWLEYRGPDGFEATLAVLSAAVAGEDAFSHALERFPEPSYPDELFALGGTIARLHEALSGPEAERHPDFAPERVRTGDVERWAAGARADLDVAPLPREEERLRSLGSERLAGIVAAYGEGRAPARAQRIHGDLHLGQVLRRGDGGCAVVDFEGEPARPIAERRAKAPVERDIAGMLRSIDYAAIMTRAPSGARERAERAFIEGYARPLEQELVELFALEKAIYEVRYESRARRGLEHVPLAGLRRILA